MNLQTMITPRENSSVDVSKLYRISVSHMSKYLHKKYYGESPIHIRSLCKETSLRCRTKKTPNTLNRTSVILLNHPYPTHKKSPQEFEDFCALRTKSAATTKCVLSQFCPPSPKCILLLLVTCIFLLAWRLGVVLLFRLRINLS